MSLILTSPEVILTIQIISIIGYVFLAIYTTISYKKLQNKTLLYISIAFAVIALSLILKVTILPFEDMFLVEEAYIEAIFESIQFLAAFLFF